MSYSATESFNLTSWHTENDRVSYQRNTSPPCQRVFNCITRKIREVLNRLWKVLSSESLTLNFLFPFICTDRRRQLQIENERNSRRLKRLTLDTKIRCSSPTTQNRHDFVNDYTLAQRWTMTMSLFCIPRILEFINTKKTNNKKQKLSGSDLTASR